MTVSGKPILGLWDAYVLNVVVEPRPNEQDNNLGLTNFLFFLKKVLKIAVILS